MKLIVDMNEIEIFDQRRQARAAKHRVDVGLLNLHQKAVNALLDPVSGEQARQMALRQIEKWQRGNLCNPRYIQAWLAILSLPAASMRMAMLRDDTEGISLRQNSPFGFLVGKAAQ